MSALDLQQFEDFDWTGKLANVQAASRLDSRFRIQLPRELKEYFKDWLYVCPGFDNALYCFTRADYTTWTKALETARAEASDEQLAVLDMMAYVVPFSLDEQKRIQLTDGFLRTWAGLHEGDQYLLTGGAGRLQIWSMSHWQARVQQAVEAASADLGGLMRAVSRCMSSPAPAVVGGEQA